MIIFCNQIFAELRLSSYQCSLHACRKVVSSAHYEKRLVLIQRLGQFLYLVVELQYLTNLTVEFLQTLYYLRKSEIIIIVKKKNVNQKKPVECLIDEVSDT